MAKIPEIGVGLRCWKCNNHLQVDLSSFALYGPSTITLKVVPCEACLEAAESRGYDRASKEQQEAVADERKD